MEFCEYVTTYQVLYSQHFIFFVTYELAHYTRLEKLVRDKQTNLFGHLKVTKKML
jgi:hypothetical protein